MKRNRFSIKRCFLLFYYWCLICILIFLFSAPLVIGVGNIKKRVLGRYKNLKRLKVDLVHGSSNTDFSGSRNGPPHSNLCDQIQWSTDKKVDRNLTWSEPANSLLNIISETDYNKYQAPGQLNGQVTTVYVAFYIESMSTFRTQSMDYEVDMYLAYSWHDQRLAHNCTHPIVVTDVWLAGQMWWPDLYFVNSKQARVHDVTTPNFMMLIYNDGLVFKSTRINVVLSCLLKLHDFPMDQQECSVQIQSFAYVKELLNLTWHVDIDNGFPISYKEDLEKGLNDMDLVNRHWGTCDSIYPMFRGYGLWSCLKGTIVMKRKLHFHFIQIFIPTAMLVCISWLSFWLDVRASPARISLTITTLLTLTTMSNGSRQDLPQVSYMKCIDRWIAACQAFVFFVLLEYTLVNVALGKDTSKCSVHRTTATYGATAHGSVPTSNNDTGRITFRIKKVASKLRGNAARPSTCQLCAMRWENYARVIDKVARILFPTGFFLFNVVYWYSYSGQLRYYASTP